MTERLTRAVREELGRLGAPDGADLAAIAGAWPELVGPQTARRSWPARVTRDGTLLVHTADSVWAHQLALLAPDILVRVRERLGAASTPTALRFAPGPLPEAPGVEESTLPSPVETGAEDRFEAARISAGVADEELRELVSRAAAASFARARSGRRF